MYPFPGMGCVRGCCGMELGNILDIVVWFRLLDGAGRCFFLSVGPFTPRDVTRVTEDTRATSFHKIHSYWEDGSPGGSDFIPQDTQLLGGRFPPGLLSKATCNVARVWRSAHGSMNWVMAERFRCSPYLCFCCGGPQSALVVWVARLL